MEKQQRDALIVAVGRDAEFFAPTWLELMAFDSAYQTFEFTMTIKAPWHIVVEEYWDKNIPFDPSLYSSEEALAQRPRENGYFPITPPEIPSGRYFAEVDEVKEPLGEPSLTQDLSFVLRRRHQCSASGAIYTVRDMCVLNELPKMVRSYLGAAAEELHLIICEYSRIDLGGAECPFAPPHGEIGEFLGPNGRQIAGAFTASFEEDIAGPRFILRCVNRDYRHLCLCDDERCFRPHPLNPNLTIFKQVSRLGMGPAFGWVRGVVRNLGISTLRRRAEKDIRMFAEKLELIMKARGLQADE